MNRFSTKDKLYKWDVFISHASEDKDEIAGPLAILPSFSLNIPFKIIYVGPL
jgi:hypothetical protein